LDPAQSRQLIDKFNALVGMVGGIQLVLTQFAARLRDEDPEAFETMAADCLRVQDSFHQDAIDRGEKLSADHLLIHEHGVRTIENIFQAGRPSPGSRQRP